jgi:iron complex outermembrane receptor protein
VPSQREANQDFDHYFAGSYNAATGQIRPNYAWQQTNNKTTSNTLDLSGKFKTGSVEHDLLVGLEASEELRRPKVYGTVQAAFTYDPRNPNTGAWPDRPARVAPQQNNRHKGEAEALYVQDLISLTPEWKLLAGLRHDRFKFHSTNYVTGFARGYDGSSTSPRLGVVWQRVATQSLYASYSKSYSPYGGRGIISVDTAATAVYDAEPQHSRQFEMGLKSDWLGGALSTQLAVYELEHYNIRYRPDAVNEPTVWAVRGKERSRGVELSAAGRVATSWYVRGGVGFMSAKVTEDVQAPANEGKYLTNTAKRNGNLFVRYAPPGPWYAEIGLTHTSARWLNAANTSQLPAYTRWDGLLGWRAAPWTVTAAVANLLDKEYWRSTAMPGAPRSFLLSANYQF